MDYPIAQSSIFIGLILTICVILLCLLSTAAYQGLLRKKLEQRSLVDRVNNLLPQTQCGQCGFEGCRPYARAILQGEPINQCPPGGHVTILKLSNLLNLNPIPLNNSHGEIKPIELAVIREDECIGCTKCIVACPVDAILGGPKLMHTVISSECTGCDLCVEPCPVDCIDMVPITRENHIGWTLPSRTRNPLSELDASYD